MHLKESTTSNQNQGSRVTVDVQNQKNLWSNLLLKIDPHKLGSSVAEIYTDSQEHITWPSPVDLESMWVTLQVFYCLINTCISLTHKFCRLLESMAHMFRYLLLSSPLLSIQQISSEYYMFSVTSLWSDSIFSVFRSFFSTLSRHALLDLGPAYFANNEVLIQFFNFTHSNMHLNTLVYFVFKLWLKISLLFCIHLFKYCFTGPFLRHDTWISCFFLVWHVYFGLQPYVHYWHACSSTAPFLNSMTNPRYIYSNQTTIQISCLFY